DVLTDAPDEVTARVLDVVRQLARETGGARAERAVAASASLEREIGLGSLERVELVARLERAFGRPLDDPALALDPAARRPRHPPAGGGRAARAAGRRAAGRPRARARPRGAHARRVALAPRRARAREASRLPARRRRARSRAGRELRAPARGSGGRCRRTPRP